MLPEASIYLLAAALTSTSAVGTSSTALTTEVRAETDSYDDLPILILRMPEILTELAVTPLVPIFLAFEKLRLHERIFDLLTNDEHTFGVLPIFDFTNRSGLSGGLAVLHNDPLGSPDRTVLLGMIRENGDRSLSFSYGRRLPSMSGKKFGLSAGYALDQDRRWFGTGGSTKPEDERMIAERSVRAGVSMEIPAPEEWTARLELGYRRQRLYSGTGDSPGATPQNSMLPAGFSRSLSYPELTATLEYDTRDSNGRPTRGVVISVSGSGTHDVDNGQTGGLLATAKAGIYIPVLPLNRVLVLAFGAATATPLGSGATVPIQHLVSLGGNTVLRGYDSDRFAGRVGWWATAEWRYAIFEYSPTDTHFGGTVFFDVGRAANDVEDAFSGPVAWSVGIGLRAELNLFFLGRIQLAYSPEGIKIVIAVNEII
jgi:outer membrane protein assembly factor BamA